MKFLKQLLIRLSDGSASRAHTKVQNRAHHKKSQREKRRETAKKNSNNPKTTHFEFSNFTPRTPPSGRTLQVHSFIEDPAVASIAMIIVIVPETDSNSIDV